MNVVCDYCHRPAELVKGNVLYPKRVDLFPLNFYRCVPCRAWVGCHKAKKGHPDTFKPLGRLANAELRQLKQQAHEAFDPLWRSKQMSRKEAYAWLASELGISVDNCHIGMMDVDGCRAVVAAVKGRRR